MFQNSFKKDFFLIFLVAWLLDDYFSQPWKLKRLGLFNWDIAYLANTLEWGHSPFFHDIVKYVMTKSPHQNKKSLKSILYRKWMQDILWMSYIIFLSKIFFMIKWTWGFFILMWRTVKLCTFYGGWFFCVLGKGFSFF